MLRDLRLCKGAERGDFAAGLAGVDDGSLDQLFPDAHAAKRIGHAGMVDDDQFLARPGVGHLGPMAIDLDPVIALAVILMVLNIQLPVLAASILLEDHPVVAEGLELESVARWIAHEHGRLLSGLVLETDIGLEEERGTFGLQPIAQRFPV